MPCLNAMPRVATALASVRQWLDGVEHEIVVSDGGSVDSTADFLRTQNVILVRGPDTSMYEGLNKAIAVARGAYLLWLNADDSLAPGAQTLAVEATRDSADMITGEARMIRDDKVEWESCHGSVKMTAASVLFGVPAINCRLISADTLRRAGPFRTDIGVGADREMMLRLLRVCGRRRSVPALAYQYSAHPGSRTLAGNWESYRRVHAANLNLVRESISDYTETADELRAFGAFSAIALGRARLMSGAIEDGAGPLTCILRHCMPMATARGLIQHQRWRGHSSGW